MTVFNVERSYKNTDVYNMISQHNANAFETVRFSCKQEKVKTLKLNVREVCLMQKRRS